VKRRVFIALVTAFATLGLTLTALTFTVLLPRFHQLEIQLAEDNAERCLAAIEREQFHLLTTAWDWSFWLDTYQFAADRNETYIANNLEGSTLHDNSLDLLAILNNELAVLWISFLDREREEKRSWPEMEQPQLPANSTLASLLQETGDRGNWLVETPSGPLLLACGRIYDGLVLENPRGFLLMGRLLDQVMVERLGQQAGQSFALVLVSAQDQAAAGFVQSSENRWTRRNEDQITLRSALHMADGRVLWVETSNERKISAMARKYLVLHGGLFLMALVAILLVAGRAMDAHWLRPLAQVVAFADSLGKGSPPPPDKSLQWAADWRELWQRLEQMRHDLELRAKDIQEQNRAREKDLEEKLRVESTLHATQNQLLRAQKMEALGLLAGGVAHDLNNILAGVVAMPELLLMDEGISPETRKGLHLIEESGRRAASIVGDLLHMARGVVVELKPLELSSLLQQTWEGSEFANLKRHYPETEWRLPQDTPPLWVLGSAHNLVKVLMNLLYNATEAQASIGLIQVGLQTREPGADHGEKSATPEGPFAVITVQDQGPGIAAEDLERIFEPFFSRKTLGRSGSGLGLAIVWSTVRSHRGFVHCSSNSQGTLFEVWLPTIAPPEEKKENDEVELVKGLGRNVLVVDDEPLQRETASFILKRLGFNPLVARGSQEAKQILQLNECPFAVLDMILESPDDGLSLLEDLLQLHPGLRACIASGFSGNERAQRAVELGKGCFLAKPYSLRALSQALHQLLAGACPETLTH
jgi:signal transduction histidine kinase/ActR/RegA family two-component response regulator